MRFALGLGVALTLAVMPGAAQAQGDVVIEGGVSLPIATTGAHPVTRHYWNTQIQANIPRPHIVPPLELRRPNAIWNGVRQPPYPQTYPYPPYGTPKAGLPYYAYGIPYAGHPGFYQFYYPHVMIYPKPANPTGYGYGYYGRPNAIQIPTGVEEAAPASTETPVEEKTTTEGETTPADTTAPVDATIPPIGDVPPAPVPVVPVPGEANAGPALLVR